MARTTIQYHQIHGPLGTKIDRRRRISICLILLLTSLSAFQPRVLAQLPRLQFHHVTMDQGLSHPAVFEICQDSNGFMWFGSFSGLNRYDGNEIKSAKTPSIHALCTATNGDVWIGSAAGMPSLSRLSASRDTTIDYRLPAFGAGVRALVNDSDGSLWIGTDAGLFHKDVGSENIILMGTQALADSGVNSMADDKHGNLWLVTRGKIARFDKVARRGYFVCQRKYGGHSAASVGPDGSIWIAGGINGLLCRINPKSMLVDTVFEKGLRLATTSLAVDASGIVYVGTSGMGLKIYDPSTRSWATCRHQSNDPLSISDDEIYTVVLDRTGNIWVGTARGVSWAPHWHRRFTFVSVNTDDKDPFRPQEVRDIVEDRDGNLWLATARGGLRKWDRNHGTVTALKVNSPDVYSLGLASRSRLWIGLPEPMGLRQLDIDDSTTTQTEPVSSMAKIDGIVTAMLREGNTTMWLGCTRSRVYRCNLRTGETLLFHYETPEELFSGRVAYFGDDCPRMIYRDRRGTLWIATQYGILNLDERSGSFRRHLHTATEEINFQEIAWFQENTWCVYEDKKGSFWVGTDVGLDLFDRDQESFQPVIHTSRRFQGRTVLGILEDKAGMLWLQTDGELLRYNHTTGETKRYGAKDGYPITMLNSFFTLGNRARCITHTGEFVFGVRDGIVIFRPEEIVVNPNKPPVIISEAKILGRVLGHTGSRMSDFFLPHHPLLLSADENSLEFKFAAFDYTMPSQNKYAVWLEPAEKDWSSLGTENSIRFVNLSPGSYRLRVKAANNDSVWSSTEASFTFMIDPPWWMAWWFRALMGLIVVGVIILVMQLRLRRAVAEEKLRTNIARDLHDDLSATLSSITFYSEAVRRSEGEQLKRYIGQISERAREAKEKISDIIWSVDPQHDDWADFLPRCERYASDMLESKGILHKVEIDKSLPASMAHVVRQNLWLIFKEIIVNLVRHSCASHAVVSISRVKNHLVITISDDGKGFNAAASNGGNGLNNIRRRAESIGASIALDTSPGGGTRWRIEVSL